MKRIVNYTFAVALAGLTLFSACKPEDEVKPKPTLTFNTGTGYTFQDGRFENTSALRFGLVATAPSGERLRQLAIKISTNGGLAATIKDTTLNASSLNYDYPFRVNGAVNDKIAVTFTVTSANGETDSKTITITVISPIEALGEIANQEIHNLIGPNKGAYDLEGGVQVGASEPEATKDLKDLTTTSTSNTHKFSQSWGSGNGTQFVRVTAADYDNTQNSLQLSDLWTSKSASATATITNIQTDDVILVRSGQLGLEYPYFLVKVTNVVLTTTDNNDKIVFKYKKKS
jgi:hypothetical protein